MLHYATAVHAILSHCVIFVNLTLPSYSVRAPLCGSMPPSQWIPIGHVSLLGPLVELTVGSS